MRKKATWITLLGAASLGINHGQAASVTYDIATDAASVSVGGAYLFQKTTTTSTGTGVFNTFLRQQDVGGNDSSDPSGLTQAAGFNSGSLANPMKLELDDSQTFDLRVGAASGSTKILTTATQNVPGSFYSFGFDVNEPNSSIQDYLSIDNLEIWVSASPILNASGKASLTSRATATDATKTFQVYSLDSVALDVTVLARAVPSASGSGKADYAFLVPQSNFTTAAPGMTASWYVYLWSEVGGLGTFNSLDYGENSGFEEWGTLTGTSFTVPPPIPEAGTFAAAFFVAVVGARQGWLRRRR